MKYRWVSKGIKFIGFALVAAFVFGFLVMLLWNALIPDLFHGPVLNLAQALGLLLLSHILLRGGGRWGHWGGWRHERWRERMDEKLASMTPEEREKFKQEWRHGCGRRHEKSETPNDAATL
jgi:hypothetical protein